MTIFSKCKFYFGIYKVQILLDVSDSRNNSIRMCLILGSKKTA